MAHPITVALQMDPIAGINITTDSTFLLALEAQRRGYSLLYYTPEQLSMHNGIVTARVQSLTVRNEVGNHFSLGEVSSIDLSTTDVVLLRQDPPFNMRYITTTHLLERIHPATLVVNNPAEVRNAPEKLFVCNFTEFMTPTLITEDRRAIAEFYREHGNIIIKPLYGNGGMDIFYVKQDDGNCDGIVDILLRLHDAPLVVQRFIPEIAEGDKRIVLIDGEPAGALNRLPAKGQVRANLAAGGTAYKTTLTARERDICAAIGPALKERGLLFVGIDVIGGYMTEINVTSPTGLHPINRLDEVQLERDIWDAIERKLF